MAGFDDLLDSLVKQAPTSTPTDPNSFMKQTGENSSPVSPDDYEAMLASRGPASSPGTMPSSSAASTESGKAPTRDAVLDFINYKNLQKGDQTNLAAARAKAAESNKSANLYQAIGDFGAGMAGVKVDPSYYNSIREENAADVKGAEGDVEGNRKIVQDYMNNKRAEEVAGDNRDARMQSSRDSASMRQLLAQQSRDSKISTDQDNAYQRIRKDLETFRGNSAAQQAGMDVLSAKKAIDNVEGRDPNSLTLQDLRLLNEELGKIATGGVPTEHGVQALMPSNLQTKYAEIQNFLSSKPTDAKAGEYIKHNMEYLKKMMGTSQSVIDDYRRNILKGAKHTLRSDDYDEAASDYRLNGSPAQAPAGPQTKVVGGKTYVKVAGGWQEQ